jgi:uncharacterized protein (TIGR03083 family)
MNATDVMRYGHGTVLATLDGLPPAQWSTPGVCGVWSVKQIVAHLASYELVLGEVLASLAGGTDSTPFLDRFKDPAGDFNDAEVAARDGLTAEATLAEYVAAHERAMELLAHIPAEERTRPGTLPWYGAEYAIDDFIVYAFYGHKREHCAQIAVFGDGLTVR